GLSRPRPPGDERKRLRGRAHRGREPRDALPAPRTARSLEGRRAGLTSFPARVTRPGRNRAARAPEALGPSGGMLRARWRHMIAIPRHRRHAALVSVLRDLTALATEPADRDVFVARLLGAACGYGAWPAARGYRYDPARGVLQPEGGWYDRGGGTDLVPLQSLA